MAQDEIGFNSIQSIMHFMKRHASLFIIIIAILIRIPYLFVPLQSGFQHTSWRQSDTASIAHNFVDDLDILRPQINWGGDGPGYVETEFQLYPFLTALLYRVFGEQLWLGILVSLLFNISTLIVFYLFAKTIIARPAALIALIFFAFVPLNLLFSGVFMPEPTVLFFYVFALYLFQKWLNEERLTLLILSAVATAFAILVKPTAIHIGFIFLFLLIHKYRLRLFTQWQIWLFAIIALLPGILWFLHARNLYLDYGNTFGIISGGDTKFDNLAYWLWFEFYYAVARIEIKWVFAIGGVLPFIIGFIQTWRQKQPMVLIYGIVAQIIYYMLIPRYVSFSEYYHIFALPFASLGVGLGFFWLYEHRDTDLNIRGLKIRAVVWRVTSIIAIILICATMVFYYHRSVVVAEQPMWDCSQLVRELVPEDALVIVSTTSPAIDNGVPNNYQEPNVFYYSHRYGWSLADDQHTIERIDEFRELGAEYFIMVDHEPLLHNPNLLDDLNRNARQIGLGEAASCSIYHFEALE